VRANYRTIHTDLSLAKGNRRIGRAIISTIVVSRIFFDKNSSSAIAKFSNTRSCRWRPADQNHDSVHNAGNVGHLSCHLARISGTFSSKLILAAPEPFSHPCVPIAALS
jgi:hypothetical protein